MTMSCQGATVPPKAQLLVEIIPRPRQEGQALHMNALRMDLYIWNGLLVASNGHGGIFYIKAAVEGEAKYKIPEAANTILKKDDLCQFVPLTSQEQLEENKLGGVNPDDIIWPEEDNDWEILDHDGDCEGGGAGVDLKK